MSEGSSVVTLTDEERRAIVTLERLAERWPKALRLFSWSGTLHVLKGGEGRTYAQATVARIDIPNDGGDPSQHEECPR